MMRRPTLTLPAIGFALVAAVGAVLASLQDRAWRLEQGRQTQELAAAQAALLQQRLGRSVSAAQTLAAIVRTQGEIEDFDQLAAAVIDTVGGITNLQLAPGGIVRRIYPLQGHEAALGHDLLADQQRRSEAHAAIETGQMVIAGPFELRQGGIGIIARQPVFVADPAATAESFWGFVSALIYVDELIEQSDMNAVYRNSHRYQLWRRGETAAERQVIAGDPQLPDGASTASVALFNLRWELSVWPIAAARNPFLLLHLVLALAAAGISAYLLYLLARQPSVLRALVAEKTRLLEIANLQLRENERHLLRQAHHDPLTGLPNRLLFNDRLHQAIVQAERDRSRFALLLIDLDLFKPVNDRWGHAAGDQVLTQVGRRLQNCARKSDTLARIGGDEFVMLLTGISDLDNAEAVARKVREAVALPLVIPQAQLALDCSIGIAVYPLHGRDSDTLLYRADRAMYTAKRGGRGGYEVAVVEPEAAG